MSTLEATMSMLESMPEEARILVYKYTQTLFNAPKPASPYVPVTTEQVMNDLAESRLQIEDGQGTNMKDAMMELGKRHGFV